MEKIYVVYWSQTGNTQAMAEAIGQGITEGGREAEVIEVSSGSVDELKDARAFALGCPSMGAEELEEYEMEPFVKSLEGMITGKTIALFGSYGWGDGQWMRDWVDRMNGAGGKILGGQGLICQENPNETTLIECRKLGKELTRI